ncbi:MAG: substrate-binding domain-containing protein, partial [Microbacteriaceae bacterium]
VTGDDAAGITAAVEHLVQLGHRRILHISGPRNFSTSLVRSDAFVAACNANPSVGYTVAEASALSVEVGESCMDTILMAGTKSPTAVVAGNDLLALGVLRSLRAHGLQCPDDISVVGFNDMPFAEDFQPALTTVRVPHLRFGSESARLLLEGIETGVQTPITITLPVSLIVRGSTATPRHA